MALSHDDTGPGAINLYTMPADKSSAPAALTTDGDAISPVWGRRGIAFTHFVHPLTGRQTFQIELLNGSRAAPVAGIPLTRFNYPIDPVAVSTSGARHLVSAADLPRRPIGFTADRATGRVHGLHQRGRLRVNLDAISRDGKQVLVDLQGRRDSRDDEIGTIPFSGGRPRVLVRNAAAPSWNR